MDKKSSIQFSSSSSANRQSATENRKWAGVVGILVLILGCVGMALAQQPPKVPGIGVLLAGSPSSMATRVDAFRQGLRELGYIEGKNIAIEYRYAEGKEDRLPALVGELLRLKVDIIVVQGGNGTSAAKNANKTIPIVMAAVSDPVGSGLVASLARPCGNITGLTPINPDLSGKRLELLKEAIPGATRVAVLIDRNNPAAILMLKETDAAAQALGLQLQTLEVSGSNELDNAFGAAKKGRSEAINVLSSSFFVDQRKEIAELATRDPLASHLRR